MRFSRRTCTESPILLEEVAEETVEVVEGTYTDVTITLDELATYITSGDGKFHSSTWLMYYQGSASIKDMTVVTL